MGRYIAIGIKDAACAVKVGVRDCVSNDTYVVK